METICYYAESLVAHPSGGMGEGGVQALHF